MSIAENPEHERGFEIIVDTVSRTVADAHVTWEQVVEFAYPGESQNPQYVFKVNYEDGLLTVSGERTFEKKDDRNYHRIERSYGSFVRSFTLPRSVDVNKIAAAYKNGILEIEIPKLEESKPKQIQINVGSQKQIR